MLRFRRERGLSEIVGFILILATIVVAMSLYITFGIPAQGREAEIQHMEQVKDRFVEYKINLDSLWTNRQCGTAIGTSFDLGTGGGATTGSFSIIPILAPAKTSATLALNQRAEYLTIAQDSYFLVDSGGVNETGIITSPVAITFNATPRYFLINFSVASNSALTTRHGVNVVPTAGSAWEAWVNTTPVYTFSRRFNITNGTGANWYKITSFREWNESRWNRTDVTVSTWKGGVPVIQDLVITTNITSKPSAYQVDLMNPAYGISTDLGSTLTPSTLTASRSDANIIASYLTNYSYWPKKSSQTSTMGSLEYDAQNEYWIQQDYYYQMGGVYLEQDDGSSVKVPPTFTFSLSNGIPVVKINQLLLTGSGVIEGSGPVQITSSVSQIVDTPLAAGNNTRFVNITVRAASTQSAQMWQRALQNAADKGGFTTNLYTNGTAGIESFLNISTSKKIYGVQLSMTNVTVSTSIQSAAPSSGG
jgi:hypothetical protein